jgi:phospholipid/cholesterol/gamma-HCH transport system substrate-binding protein
MSSFDQINPVRVGILGLLLTAAVVLTAQSYDKVPLVSARPEYSGYFGDTGGLKAGSEVEVAGIKVGKVQDVRIQDSKVRVDFNADGIMIGDKTTLAIKTQTVLGSKFLQVDPRGSRRQGRGVVIPLARTTTPYLLTDSLGQLTTTISGLDTRQISNALDTLSATLDKTAPNLSAALNGVSRFSATISSRDQVIQQLFGNAQSVTGILSRRSDQINRMLLDGNVLFDALDQRRQAIDTLLNNITSVAAQLQGLIDDNQKQLQPSLDQLNQVVALLDKHKKDIQDSLKPLQQYATSLGESVASGPFFSAYVMNLLPGQFLQPFIDAAFKKQGLDPKTLGGPTFPVNCGDNTPPGTVPPDGTKRVPNPSSCPAQPGQVPGNPPASKGPKPNIPPGNPASPSPPPPRPLFPGIPGIPGLGG